YRGFMLDVARNFHSKAAALRTLDLLARYKINVFHLHLTDDEGWRIEIPSLPELTAVGARRGHPPDSDRHLPPAFGSGPDVDRPFGSGFYSRADYIEMLRYAAARHIEVVPEIEMPGHARAAIKAMQGNQSYRLDDPADGRVEQILKAQGLLPSGWEEIAVRKTSRDGRRMNIPNPDFAARGWRAYVWNNVPGGGAEDLAYRLANGGYDVVLSPVSNLYFDLAWNENPEETGLDWGGYVDLRKPFDFIPFDYYRNVRVDPSVFVGKDPLTDYGRAHIVGIQGNLWSETLGGDGRLEYMMLPKLFALAERAWAPDPDRKSTRLNSSHRTISY